MAGYQVDNDLNVGGTSPWLVRLCDEHRRHDLALRGQRTTFAANGRRSHEPLAAAAGDPWFKLEKWHEYHLTCVGPRIAVAGCDRNVARDTGAQRVGRGAAMRGQPPRGRAGSASSAFPVRT